MDGPTTQAWRPILLAGLITAAAVVFFSLAGTLSLALQPGAAALGIEAFCRWDCAWYEKIASQGYDRVPRPDTLEASFGFFPGYPVAVWPVMQATGLSFAASGLLLNVIYTGLFAWLVLTGRSELLLKSERDALVFLAAFLLTPWSLYNRVPYTEMQFNLALLGTFIAWRREQYVAAALLGVILTATRVTGVLLPLLLAGELLLRERGRVTGMLAAPDGRFRALAIMPLGGIAFLVYLAWLVGDPLANLRVQAVAWGHTLGNPLLNIIGGLRSGEHTGVIAAVACLVCFAGLAAGLAMRRIPPVLAAMVLVIGVSSFASSHDGVARYVLALFPFYLVVPALPPIVRWPLLILLALFQILFVIAWPGNMSMLF